MTQRIQAEMVIQNMGLPRPEELKELEDVVGKSQNGPPLGERDGSINETAWTALRDAVDQLKAAKENLEVFHRTLS